MNNKNSSKIVCTTLLLLLAFSMAVNGGLSFVVNANPTGSSAKIWTNKADYHPGTISTIYGTGFLPNMEVALQITKVKDGTFTSWNVVSNSQGSFITSYQIDKQGAPLYKITATDGTNTAKTTFTDSSFAVDSSGSNSATSGSTVIVGSLNCAAGDVIILFLGPTAVLATTIQYRAFRVHLPKLGPREVWLVKYQVLPI